MATTSIDLAGFRRLPSDVCLPTWALLVLPGTIWGASFMFMAEGLHAVAPNGLAFARVLIGFGTLALVPAARRPVARGDWPRLVLLGVVWMALPLTLFPFAEQRVSSALTGLLNGAIPVFTALVGLGLTRRPPARGVAAGLALGLTGAALTAWPSIHAGHNSLSGIVMILAALICYGFALHVALPLQRRHGALPVIWRAQAVALALTAPLGLPELAAARWSAASFCALLTLGALGTAWAHVLLALAAARVGATRASATTFLIPGVALILGVLRGEHVAGLAVLGGAVCVAGAWCMRRAQEPSP